MTQLKQEEALESFRSKLQGHYDIFLASETRESGYKRLTASLIINERGEECLIYQTITPENGLVTYDNISKATRRYFWS